MKRWILVALGVVLAAAVGIVFMVDRRRDSKPRESAKVRELRVQHEALHEQLESHLAAEPILKEGDLQGDHVVVAIRSAYLGNVVREVARRYLDHVQLDLAPDIRVKDTGEMKTKTPLGSMKLGDWAIDLNIARLSGVLAAQAPDIEVAGENRVRVTMPVRIVSARGKGVAQFSWDSSSVASLVCKDFSVEEQLEATAFSDVYRVRGAFAFFQQAGNLVARPEFPHEKFRVRIDLVPESWAKVEAALTAQDTWSRCGIALDPKEVLPKLRELAGKGFEFKLPRSLFRAIAWPAQFRSRVDVQGTAVDVAVTPKTMRLIPEYLWYAASLRARILTAGSANPSARPTPWHH
jgi:hypothetical protein